MFRRHIISLGSRAHAELNPLAHFPTLSKTYDSYGQPSFSTAFHDGNPALLGELVERQHFFSSVKPDIQGTLSDFCSEHFRVSFSKLVSQTCPPSFHDLDIYDFELSSCLNIATNEEEYIPTLLASLGPSKDNFWVPDRDTSGCASHTEPEKAFDSALMEFLERQNLTASWIGNFCRYRIDLTSATEFPSTLTPILNMFLKQGDVYAVNTSRLFSCYAIMVIFIAHSDQDHVKFSMGSSCHLDPHKALQKALLEMCQSFTLMSEVHSRTDSNAYTLEKKTHQKLTQNFCDANRRSIIEEFPYLRDSETPVIPLSRYLSFKIIQVSQILKEMREISINLFYYSASISLMDSMCFFGRVISPDFYITMDNTLSFNLHNTFSKALGITCNKSIPLPFS